jgi:hypothetical protein
MVISFTKGPNDSYKFPESKFIGIKITVEQKSRY